MSALLDAYAGALDPNSTVRRIAVRDLSFNPNLRAGYAADQPWEPDLEMAAAAIDACDHLVVGFPLWWGGEPAVLKGLLDRVILPGFAFKYHRNNPFWDRLLKGRSADVIVTMDTPPWYLRLVYGDPVMRRWRKQVLGFCGFRPIRVHRFGATRRGEATRQIDRWRAAIALAAQTAPKLRRGARSEIARGRGEFKQALEDRRS